ncbi:NRDE family protein [Plastoroseomonas arctica]|uniref:NRDE family protein n=1 Tax=Plastoroseomonas arctica TaxID=1509237 RepID=A0AAF1KHG5_9PROT|nr:NRDE family protein [Plastoroseomonas arctica]MBR0653924.1 NRDE family protein [Plastoroseomonas arctica]
MCTLILLRRPGHGWPLLLAANRDERLDRAWEAPAEFWPGITGGRDATGGGTWLALSRHGVVAGVLNRPGSLGPAPGKRSRGELPLMAAGAASAAAAAAAIGGLDSGEWRSFNLVVADRDTAWFLRGEGAGPVAAVALAEGVTMVTSMDPNHAASPRVRRHLPRFEAAAAPSPPDWGTWPALLRDSGGDRAEALNVPASGGFGTVSASLIGLGAGDERAWQFAPGSQAPFAAVSL